MGTTHRRVLVTLGAVVALVACQSDGSDDGGPTEPGPEQPGPTQPGDPAIPGDEQPSEPGASIDVTESDLARAERARVEAELAEVAGLDRDGLFEAYPVELVDDLGYVPREADGMQIIQESPYGLDEAALTALDTHGFIVSGQHAFPTFVHGYARLYTGDLPLFVSADSILYGIHEGYNEVLKALEYEALSPALGRMLGAMKDGLTSEAVAGFGEDATRDVDFYLTVAEQLLTEQPVPPRIDANADRVGTFVEKAKAASGAEQIELFGVRRRVDFSQFEPRGHYTESDELKRYFRAMMWLGRIDFRLVETQADGSQVFHRRQLEAVLAMRASMSQAARADWKTLDRAIEAFVGESDNMVLDELEQLMADLGADDPAGYKDALAAHEDDAIAAAILAGDYGTQRISSHYMVNGMGSGTLPLSSTFLLLGQRYVVDSHVFSNVVYDRVNAGATRRMMPDPLDAAFAALGNDDAARLLADELDQYGYAADLAAMRVLVDAHGEDFFNRNLYNLWLRALRALSPDATRRDPGAAGRPRVTATEGWGRRVLNTQLASWAELRHDTILYAKQSYSGGPGCDFPDAYVEPEPDFFAAIGDFGARIGELTAEIAPPGSSFATRVGNWATNIQDVASTLGEMAEYQLRGEPFSEAHMAFINDAVVLGEICGGEFVEAGWYAQMFFGDPTEWDPTIADVHTQPTDENGVEVGRILHVATGTPRLMVMTADTCNGPRAYAGLVSSYHEVVTDDWVRRTDDDWAPEAFDAPPVDWFTDLVAGEKGTANRPNAGF